ncbi:hypothetical protein WJX81_008328 [Elliptochloris bilobata]|uniref:ER membrane protein complex subunit 2 n=1 Tax=Elliptochloris bilobata TaxID=381761 RepID=A0AAW1SDG9_9CHLO
MGSTKKQLEQDLAELEHVGTSGRAEALRSYLRLVRELKVRDSENVTVLGEELLRKHRARLGAEELWLTMEQVATAALDCRALPLAASIVTQICEKFPESLRAARMMEMLLEARGKYEDASKLIQKHLEDAPDCQMLLKRQVALEKSQGNVGAAIEALRKYVDVFQTDREAWEELGSLYVQAQMYAQAAACYEEVLLHAPASIAAYVQLADVLYTAGPGPAGANSRAARTHYAAAVELSGGTNARALYGLCAVTAQLGGLRGAADPDGLAAAAAATLVQRYAEEAPAHLLPLAQEMLRAQGLTGKAGKTAASPRK